MKQLDKAEWQTQMNLSWMGIENAVLSLLQCILFKILDSQWFSLKEIKYSCSWFYKHKPNIKYFIKSNLAHAYHFLLIIHSV